MTLPADALREARTVLTELATTSPSGGLWHEVEVQSRAEADLPANVALRMPLQYLGDRDRLRRRLGASMPFSIGFVEGSVTLEWTDPVDELEDVAQRHTSDVRHAMDILLRRAFDPFEALATWPLEVFFDQEDVDLVQRLDVIDEGVEQANFDWNAENGMNYRGYVCAIVKVTRLCNLRCTYCNDWRTGPDQIMPVSVRAHLFQRLLSCPGHGTVDIVWHGGEPTTLKRHGFLRVLALQRRFRRPGQRITNRVQTNATQIDAAWVAFLKRYRFRVGVSIDGPPEFHNRSRPDAGGGPTFDRVRRGMKLIREAGLLAHVYIVINDKLVDLGAERLFDFLHQEEITWVGLLPMRPPNGLPAADANFLDRTKYAQFLLDLYHVRQKNQTPWVEIRELDAALRAAKGMMPGHCELLGNCVGAFFSIDPDGSVGHCDKYVGDPEFTLGNVVDHDFDDIRRRIAVRRLRQANRQSAEVRSNACPYFSMCQGWCPHERYIAERYQADAGASCCGLEFFFESLTEEVDGAFSTH